MADPTISKINSLTQILKENQGSMSYEAWVPSLNKNIPLKMLTTGQFTTISKYALVSDNLEFQKALLATIKELQLNPPEEQLDIYQITDADRVSILLSIILNNCREKLIQEITCTKCEQKFDYTINFAEILAGVKEHPADIIKDYIIKDKAGEEHQLKVISGIPVIKVNLSFFGMVERAIAAKEKQNMPEEEIRKLEIEYNTKIPMMYVRDILFDNETIGFQDMNLTERIILIESLPKEVYVDLINMTTDTKYNPTSLMFKTIDCPHCQNKMEYNVEIRDFFI